MPLYEYQCESCGRRTEVMQSFTDPPASTCEECGGVLKKLLSAPGIHFKGSGWYVSDYARGGSAAAASGSKEESKGEPKPDSAGGSKTESKSEGGGEKKGDAPAASAPSTPSRSGGDAG